MKHAKVSHKKRKSFRSYIVFILAAAFVAALSGGIAAIANNSANAPTQQVVGRVEKCKLTKNVCTVSHKLGVKPTAVVVTPTKFGQYLTVDSAKITEQSYLLRVVRSDGTGFEDGTTVRFNAVYTYQKPVTSTPSPTATTTTPTASPTTTTPTASPTSTSSPAGYACDPTGAKMHFYPQNGGQGQGSDAFYEGTQDGFWGQYNVSAEQWAVKDDYLSNLCAYSKDNWYVEAKSKNHGDGAVQAYPSIRKIYHNWGSDDMSDIPKISEFAELKVDFAHTDPANCTGCIYNDAFDIWLNGIGGSAPELMIWTHNHGQTPYGPRKATNITVDGRQWNLHHSGSYIAYVPVNAGTNISNGTIDVKAFVNDLVARGVLTGDPRVGQVSYGVEVVDTDGAFKKWNFSKFKITEAKK